MADQPNKLDDSNQDNAALEEGTLLDYITNKPLKETPKELVRQRIARALFHEYGISVDDMEPDFRIKIEGKQKKVDIAIFEHGKEHSPETIRRIVICEKEANTGKKSTYRLRDHQQAEKEFELLYAAMAAVESCKYGMWTNGLELFFLKSKSTVLVSTSTQSAIGRWQMKPLGFAKLPRLRACVRLIQKCYESPSVPLCVPRH